MTWSFAFGVTARNTSQGRLKQSRRQHTNGQARQTFGSLNFRLIEDPIKSEVTSAKQTTTVS